MLIQSKTHFTNGFSLFEVLMSLVLGSLLMLVLLHFYPLLFQSAQVFKAKHQLQLEADSILDKITKDLYRAGFVAQDPKFISEPIFSFQNHCLIVLYDLERNGKMSLGEENSDSDRFAYRLVDQNLEYKRGAKSCSGVNWYKLNDPEKFFVSDFKIIERAYSYQIRFTLASKKNPDLIEHFSTVIRKYHYATFK